MKHSGLEHIPVKVIHFFINTTWYKCNCPKS